MNRFARFICLLISLVIISISQTFSQRAYLSHFTTKSGLPGNNCYFVLQDAQGFIWVSTDAGVSRYDGKYFENFTVDDGLSDNQILHIKQDRQGRIWFLSLNGKLSYFYNGRIFNAGNDTLLQKLEFDGAIVSFLEDSSGRLWFGTGTNLLGMWDGKKLHEYRSKDNNAQFINAYVDEDSSGNISVFTTQAAFKFQNNRMVRLEGVEMPLSYKSIQKLPNGNMAFLKRDGIYEWNNGKSVLLKKVTPEILTKQPGFFYLKNDKAWLSTADGIYVVDEKQQTQHYMVGISTNQAVKDRDGNFWFTTGNGLYLLPDKPERLNVLNKEFGLTTNAVTALTMDKRRRLWLGMDDGSINILDTAMQRTEVIRFTDKKYQRVKQLEFDADGNNLFFASGAGMGVVQNALQPNKHVSYLQEVNNLVFSLKSFSISPNNEIAMALASGVALIDYVPGSFRFDATQYKENVTFFKNRAFKVLYNNRQELWFSNINGLSKVKGHTNTLYSLKGSIIDKRINDICTIEGSMLALATDGYGILLFLDGKIGKRITTKNGLSSNICYKLFYKHGYLWAITNLGVNRINLENTEEDIKTFEYAGDLLMSDVNDLYIDDKNAYFATNSGLVYFSNGNTGKKYAPIKVFITSINVNGNAVDLSTRNLEIAPGRGNINFNYSAVDFRNRRIRYRYRLHDDAPWIETKNRRLEFTSLEPGSYVFEVSARTMETGWGPATVFSFELERQFWQTTWFWLLVSLAGASLLFMFAVIITRRQKNKEKLELTVRNKILTLEQQALQAMMNPHFIFNVMNAIQHFMNTQDKVAANKILTGFARLIRKNMDIVSKSFISIEEELEYLNLYLNLEKSRFGEKFDFKIDVAPSIDTSETMIPSMLLQPFVENAIWHGLMPKETHGEVHISIRQSGNVLQITIDDDGIGYENSLKQQKHGHISRGMSLTRDRIALINSIEQNSIQLSVQQKTTGGTCVEILIPILE